MLNIIIIFLYGISFNNVLPVPLLEALKKYRKKCEKDLLIFTEKLIALFF